MWQEECAPPLHPMHIPTLTNTWEFLNPFSSHVWHAYGERDGSVGKKIGAGRQRGVPPHHHSPHFLWRESRVVGIDLNFPLIFPGNSMNSGLQMCLCFKQISEVSWENYQYKYWKPELCFFHVVLTMQQIVFDMLLVTQKFEIWLRHVIN